MARQHPLLRDKLRAARYYVLLRYRNTGTRNPVIIIFPANSVRSFSHSLSCTLHFIVLSSSRSTHILYPVCLHASSQCTAPRLHGIHKKSNEKRATRELSMHAYDSCRCGDTVIERVRA